MPFFPDLIPFDDVREAKTHRVVEWLLRADHGELLDQILSMARSDPRGRISVQSAARSAILQYIGPLGVPAGDRLEILVVLLECGLCTVNWDRLASLIGEHLGSSSTASRPARPPTGTASS